MIKWKNLDSTSQLESIIEDSYTAPQVIFKHSTTCPISSIAKSRLEGGWNLDISPYYLDLLLYRSISNEIESSLGIRHESPQILLIHNGKVTYNESHLDISADKISENLG